MRKAFLLCSLVVGVLAVVRVRDRHYSGSFRVCFFDVGQGDAALLRFPGGTAWLVDAGGGWKAWDRGQRELPLELFRMGVLSLDRVWLSHPDADHGLGIRGLLENIEIREFVWNAAFTAEEHPLLSDLRTRARKKGVQMQPMVGSGRENREGVELDWLALPPSRSKNDSPLVLWVSYQGCRFLFAGDAERRAEQALVKTGEPAVHVLKVNHHGSRTSSSVEFLRWADPLWAVASVGRGNRYGHPAPAVAQRLVAQGVRWLRTDVHGYVEFTVKNGEAVCRSAEGDCGRQVCVSR